MSWGEGMLHIIDTQATLTDGTAAALAVVADGSLTVFSGIGQPFLRAVGHVGNDVVYIKVHNNSKDWPQLDLTYGVVNSLDTDGVPYIKIPPQPVEPTSIFTVTGKSVAG